MQSNYNIRYTMMGSLQVSLNGASERVVIFKSGGESGVELCRMPFQTFSVLPSGQGSWAVGEFELNGSTELVGTVVADGSVDYFEIMGKQLDPSGTPTGSDVRIVWGTVGPIGSERDLEFTTSEWTGDSNARINKLRIVLK